MKTRHLIITWIFSAASIPCSIRAADLVQEIPMPQSLSAIDVMTGSLDLSAYKIAYNHVQSWNDIQDKLLLLGKDQPYYELTNFFLINILIDGKIWPSSEHYYLAMKFPDYPCIQEQIRGCATANLAFELVQKKTDLIHRNWHNINLNTMKRAVWAKFSQHQSLALLLISTQNKVLISKKNGIFGGAGENYKGKNYLGRILMLVRDELIIQHALTQPFAQTNYQHPKTFLDENL